MPRQDNHGEVRGKASTAPYYNYSGVNGVEESELFAWLDVDDHMLAQCIDAVTERGHAISFARNRDGTVGIVTILAGADRPKFYVTTAQQALKLLGALISTSPT